MTPSGNRNYSKVLLVWVWLLEFLLRWKQSEVLFKFHSILTDSFCSHSKSKFHFIFFHFSHIWILGSFGLWSMWFWWTIHGHGDIIKILISSSFEVFYDFKCNFPPLLSPLKGLFAFIFKLVGIAVILGACFGMVGIGWIYAFGDCSGRFFIIKLGFQNLLM